MYRRRFTLLTREGGNGGQAGHSRKRVRFQTDGRHRRHRSNEEMVESIEASGADIITVAIRRLDLDNLEEKNILDYFDWNEYTILPNTAGCKTADEAVFTAHLAREVTGSDWIKLEVIPYSEYLLPDPRGTYEAAKQLSQRDSWCCPTSTPILSSPSSSKTSAARRSCPSAPPSAPAKAYRLSTRSS